MQKIKNLLLLTLLTKYSNSYSFFTNKSQTYVLVFRDNFTQGSYIEREMQL